MNQVEKPVIYQGKIFTDERGTLKFVNDFDFQGVKRSYITENSTEHPIRAFQCHHKEAKYVSVITGKAVVVVVPLNTVSEISMGQKPQKYYLDASIPQVLYIPAGYANGFKSLEPHTQLIFYSTHTLDESKTDSTRLPFDHWGKEVWEDTDA